MPERKLTDKESLQIIEQMIGRARQEERTTGWKWMVWGGLLFIASLIHYWFLVSGIPYGNVVWTGFGIAAALLVVYSTWRHRSAVRKGNARTYTGDLVNNLGHAFFLSLVIVSFGNATTGLNENGSNFGYLLLLYAFWMYIHGSAFRFRLLTYGAFVNWAGAIAIFSFYEELGRNILLLHAFCVFLGYIIPGYVAERKMSGQSKPLMNL
jgi:hypothetical protein